MYLVDKLLQILILGVIGGAIPGPILTSVFTEVLNAGFLKSLRVVFRAFIVESLIVISLMLVLSLLEIPEIYFHIISFGGVVVMLWIAWQIWRIEQFKNDKTELFTLSKIILLTILNGGFWIFWMTVSIPMAFELNNHIAEGKYIFLLIFEVGWLIATVGLAFIFSRFRPLLERKNLVSTTFRILSIVLALMAIKLVIENASYLSK